MIVFETQTTAGNNVYSYVVTDKTTAQIPDLSAFDIAFPKATDFLWEVYGIGPFSSMDAVTTADSFENCLFPLGQLPAVVPVAPAGYHFPSGDAFVGASDGWTFKTGQ